MLPLHKKGDKLICSNYRGINLLVTAYKILTSIIHDKMKPYAESIIGEYQAGFRKGRSTADQLFTIRQIIETFWEYDKYQIHLFIDFKQAYDSIHRQSMWCIMREMGIPAKLVRMTQACYKNTICSIRYGRKMSTPIEIKTGLKQGCILSPLLFNIMMEKVARTITNSPEGIEFRDLTVNCLGYADDIDIITEDLQDTERLTNSFREAAEKIGLRINQEKTKVMEIARRYEMDGHVNIDGMEVEVVETFKYLGMTVARDGNIKEEINERIGAANRCLFSLISLLKKRSISERTKLRVYNTIIRPVLIYGCETWSLTKKQEKRLEVFENKVLRIVTGPVYDQGMQEWRRRHNWELRGRTKQPHISQIVKGRRIQWAGHMARMEEERMPRSVFLAQVDGRRPLGRPRKDWRRCLEEDIEKEGVNPRDWMTLAQDRRMWNNLSRAVMGQQVAPRPME